MSRIEQHKALCDKYIGFKNISNNGMQYEVIDYINAKNIIVKFEDNTIVNTNQNRVVNGTVPHPTYTARLHKRNNHIGEQSRSTSGMIMTIIAFRLYNDIDVQFEDGAIVTHKNYGFFKTGEIKHPDGTGKGVIPSQRIGMKVKQTNGQIAEIIDYRTQIDIDIRFEDGTVLTGRRYKAFLDGQIRNPNFCDYGTVCRTNRIGKTSTSLDGQTMTIIEYKNSKHMTVKFDDGSIASAEYTRFKEGKMRSPKWFKNKYEGLESIPQNGIKYKVIEAIDAKNIKIRFETGYERTVKTSDIAHNKIKHPLPYDIDTIRILSVAYVYENTSNYEYVCCKCGHTDIGTINEIRSHICNE